MIIVNIIGGLGNQMFQYAFGYAVSRDNNTELRIDIDGFDVYNLRDYELDLYQVKESISFEFKYKFLVDKLNVKNKRFLTRATQRLSMKLLNLSQFFYQEKRGFIFHAKTFNVKENTYFYGYWQNERYFKKYRDEILEIFTLKSIHSQTEKYQQKIIESDSVSLHIRRTDYVTDFDANSVHGVIDIDYYKRSVSLLQGDSKHFFIFSDDFEWAKNNLNFIDNKEFVDLDKNIPDHEEIYLMSQCNHNIIANSSFSWWGAWLNKNPHKKVIAPKKWLKDPLIDTIDLIPESWIRL